MEMPHILLTLPCAVFNMKILAVIEAVVLCVIPLASSISLNRVSTTSGLILGHASPNRSEVVEYLGIPYAGSVSGSQRFLPPRRFNSSAKFDASTWVRNSFHTSNDQH